MNLIFFSRREGLARHFNLSHPLTLGVLGALALGILTVAFALGMQLGERSGIASVANTGSTVGRLATEERAELTALRQQVQDRVDAVAMRVGQMNAHLIRLDALGKRLTQMANINSREFNFDSEPAVGGPDEAADGAPGRGAEIPDLTAMMNEVEQRLETRDAQLLALENVIISRRLNEAIQPEGRPILEGFISSYYGDRQDPFSGHEALHKGVDFAGEKGSEIVAVAAGVVTTAENRTGYGNLIEINHGNGLRTRYAHNQRGLVVVGQTVTRGQPRPGRADCGRSGCADHCRD
ncbi:MAG TPA: M23 family metallopeptidase [Steroidobacteraceae bacterium]|nr:M23 family metallopeptidase [Steroidobacteraceae bacterium]